MKKGTSVWHGLLNVLLELTVNKCKCITLFKNVKQLFKNVNNKADSVCCEAEVQSFERLLTVTQIHCVQKKNTHSPFLSYFHV